MNSGGSTFAGSGRPVRWRAAVLAGTIEAAVIVGIVHALGFDPAAPVSKTLTSLSVFTPEPSNTPPPPPPPQADSQDAGKAAPPAMREKAAAVIAPPVPLPTQTMPAAPVPGVGVMPRNGAAPVPGPGSGAGGVGNGTGAGGNGNGDGAGGDEPELTKGRIDDKDYPFEALEQRAKGLTRTEIDVSVQGRPTGCRVLKSSGFPILDNLTCRLALKRFRFKAARDASGQPIAGSVYYEQDWQLGRVDGDQ
jgi:protein TonB